MVKRRGDGLKHQKEKRSGGEGFGFNFTTASVSATPLPPAWTMLLMGLVGFGFVARRRESNPGQANVSAAVLPTRMLRGPAPSDRHARERADWISGFVLGFEERQRNRKPLRNERRELSLIAG
jgi:MYXO-CTERM domain-containing protein